jgi:lipoprotein-releasing system permease protein
LVLEFFRHFIFSQRAGSLVRRIAWLSIISISFSVSAFLLVLFVMNGMNYSISKRIIALEPHLTINVAGVKDAKSLELQPVYIKLKERAGLDISLYESQDVILRSAEGQFRGATAEGISEASMMSMQHRLDDLNRAKRNRHRQEAELERWTMDEIPGEGEVALGADLAVALRVSEGDFLTVIPPESLLLPPGEAPRFDRVRIRKIIYTNLADIDGQYMFYQRGRALVGLQNSSSRKLGLQMWTPNIKDVDDIKESAEKFQGVTAETWVDRNSDLFFALRLEKIAIGVFLGLAGMLSASSIVGVLSLLLFQKRREIKLLRALGLSTKRTLEIFSKIGLMLTLSGVISGAVFGTGLSMYIEGHPLNILSDAYYDTQVPARVDWFLVVLVVLVSTLIGYLGAWIPAKNVSTEEIGKI